jgi:hypothetical protein
VADKTYPNRVRIHRGRNTHAVGSRTGFFDPVTACGYPVGPGDDQKPNDADVTCRSCLREMDR